MEKVKVRLDSYERYPTLSLEQEGEREGMRPDYELPLDLVREFEEAKKTFGEAEGAIEAYIRANPDCYLLEENDL